LDYFDFKKVAFMLKDGLHLKQENREIILSVKNNMNSKRSFEERWGFFEKIESIKLNNE